MLLVLLAMSAKNKKGPTFVAKKGNVEVPIYTIKPGCPNQQYVVCHYEGGKRQRRNFSDLEKAKAEATIVAEKLSKGDLEAIRLTGLDRLAYLAAQEHLRPTGVPVALATKEYAAAHRLSNGYPLLEIVRFFNENGGASFAPKKVADVLRELLEVKEGNDLSDVYIKDLRCRLTVFEQAESGERKEWNDRVRILPLSFDTVLTRAKSRLLKLYDRVKSAPFLRGQNIDVYLDESVESPVELALDTNHQTAAVANAR